MKILQTSSFIQQNIQSTKNQKTDAKYPSTNIKKSDSSNLKSSSLNIQSLKTIHTLQQDHVQTQRLLGSLTQLIESLKSFKQTPSVYEENIKNSLLEIKKDFPEFTKKIEQHINNPEQMIVQANKIKNEITAKINTQKKVIAHYLISEQNKDAVQKKSVTTNDTQKIVQKITDKSLSPLHNSQAIQITKLLNS
ncbi:MAG: hypothetical protein KFW21_02200 [Spirochaetota bacterium]|nr:hypothetical protein [Spirochaetota bacterium]